MNDKNIYKNNDNDILDNNENNVSVKKENSINSELCEDHSLPSLDNDASAEYNKKSLSYDDLEKELEISKQKEKDNWDKAIRAMAELENVRKRSERDIIDAHKYGISKILIDFLPVIDSLEHALQDKNTKQNTINEGLLLIQKLFIDALEKHGVKQLNPKGEIFNPQEHEAMSVQENSTVHVNTILEVYQKGYKIYDRIIRPARVIIAKATKQ